MLKRSLVQLLLCKAELDKLVADEVTAPVTEPTKWVSALLVVQKAEGQGVRICIDRKFLNRALHILHADY